MNESFDECGYKFIGSPSLYMYYHYSIDNIRNAYPNQLIYLSASERLETFFNWPRPEINVVKLSEAGFFYHGRGDKVICFHCNVCIHDWQLDDDPLVEHARYSPRCHFIYVKCGMEFIFKSVITKRKPQVPKAMVPKDDRYKCKVCKEKEIECILNPCEHAVSCTDCILDKMNCPICQTHIKKVMRLSLID